MRVPASNDVQFDMAFQFLTLQIEAMFARDGRFITYLAMGNSEPSVGQCSTSRVHSKHPGFFLRQLDHHHDFRKVASLRTLSRFCRERYRILSRSGTLSLSFLALSFHPTRASAKLDESARQQLAATTADFPRPFQTAFAPQRSPTP